MATPNDSHKVKKSQPCDPYETYLGHLVCWIIQKPKCPWEHRTFPPVSRSQQLVGKYLLLLLSKSSP